MIEEIKKEIEHCFDDVYLEDKTFVINKVLNILDKYKYKEEKYKKLYFGVINNAIKDFHERTKDVKDDWLGYLTLDCPVCGRHRVELIKDKVTCEKCGFELTNLKELEEHGIGVE